MALNAKGTPKNALSNCSSLEDVTNVLTHMTNNQMPSKDICEVFRLVFDYVCLGMRPSFDDIDHMLTISNILIQYKLWHEYKEFILNCPQKFIVAYANNSERTPRLLRLLQKNGLNNICAYLIEYVDKSKLATWNERNNSHLREYTLVEVEFSM